RTFDFLKQALELWQQVGDLRQQVLAHLKFSSAHKRLGEQHASSFHFDEALRLSRIAGDKPLEAFLLINLCGADQSEDKRDAFNYLGDALELCRTSDHAICEAAVLLAFAVNHESVGHQAKALDYYEQVLRFTGKLGDHGHEVFALIHTGELFFYQSNYQKAIDYYTQALSTSGTNGNHWGEAYALFSLGRVHELLGDPEKALQYHEQSLPHWRLIRDYDGVAYTVNQIAMIHASRAETDTALVMLNEALELMRYVQDRYGEARTLDNIGMVYASRREHQKALEFFSQALALRRAGNDGSGEARTLANIGLVFDAKGEKQKAVDYLSQAMLRYQSIANRSGEADTHYRLAVSKRAQGNEKEARTEVEKAVAIAESLRASVYSRNLRESYFASIQTYYEFYIDLLMQLHKQHPSELLDQLALNIVEPERARGLLEVLIASPG